MHSRVGDKKTADDTQPDDAQAALATHRATVTGLAMLARGAGHSINNFLCVAKGNLLLLHEELENPEMRELADAALAGMLDAERLANGFSTLAFSEAFRARRLDPAAFLQQVRNNASKWAGGLEIETRGTPQTASVFTDERYFEMALNALLLNAREATDGMAARRVRCSVTLESPGSVAFTVADSGPGIPERIKAKVFDGGITSKARAHVGLGLWFVREFALASGGTVSLASDPDLGGASITIHLPLPTSQDVKA